MSQVVRAEPIDDLTVRVHLSEADGLFPLHAASWRVPAPKAYAETLRDVFDAAPVGTGPFKVVDWIANKVTMTANRASWRPPKLDGLEIVEAPDETARLQTFLSGAAAFVMGVTPENRAEIEARGGKMVTRKTLMVHFYGYNTTRETPLKDPRVRLALNLSVNRDAITKTVLLGSTVPASQLAVPGTFGYADELKPYPYDPARAKKLLAEAGFPKGLSLTLGMASGLRPSDAANAQQAAEDLAKIGVKLTIRANIQQKQQLDMFTGKLGVDLFTMFTRSVDAMADYRHRTCLHPVPARLPFHCDPAIVDVAKSATAETDLVKRAALYRQVATMEHDSPAGLILWQGAEFDALSPRITGYDPAYDLLRLDEIDLKP
jgi:peptide/nickel transport system substrate-binding protein